MLQASGRCSTRSARCFGWGCTAATRRTRRAGRRFWPRWRRTIASFSLGLERCGSGLENFEQRAKKAKKSKASRCCGRRGETFEWLCVLCSFFLRFHLCVRAHQGHASPCKNPLPSGWNVGNPPHTSIPSSMQQLTILLQLTSFASQMIQYITCPQ